MVDDHGCGIWWSICSFFGSPKLGDAGHKDPGRTDDARILDETAEYLHTARQMIVEKPTAREFFDVMTRRYPDRLNPGTVWLNAQRLA